MLALLIIIHVLVSIVLILVVLLQSGKAGDLASAFGGVGSQTAFGARGAATFLSKATTVCAVVFMLSSLGLSIMLTRGSGSTVMENVPYPDTPPAAAPAQQQPSPAPSQPPAQQQQQQGPAQPPAQTPPSQ
ncbi:MAG: preprotein translocase subunit SecG [Acidobacteria bacterium]|nr:preprotein translocase subunit SecG [Acidobacteriota bacterium]